jgi:hypothetical protein
MLTPTFEVLTSFLATAYLTLICCIAKYVLDRKTATSTRKHRLKRWSLALETTIISFSDQQVVTGISIIIGGLSQLEWRLAVYHFQAVGNLAWFSTMTHILTLTVLREKMRSNKIIRILRIVLMGCLAVLLIFVMAPIGYLTSSAGEFGETLIGPIPLEFPAWCLYHLWVAWKSERGGSIHHTGPAGYNLTYSILTLGVIVYSYTSRVLLLFPGLVSRSMLRIPTGQPWTLMESKIAALQTVQTTTRKRFLGKAAWLGHSLLFSFYIFLVSGAEFYTSKIWEV